MKRIKGIQIPHHFVQFCEQSIVIASILLFLNPSHLDIFFSSSNTGFSFEAECVVSSKPFHNDTESGDASEVLTILRECYLNNWSTGVNSYGNGKIKKLINPLNQFFNDYYQKFTLNIGIPKYNAHQQLYRYYSFILLRQKGWQVHQELNSIS